MASEIRVNQIQSRTGVSTISFTETGPIISGVTTITGDLDVTGLVSYDDVTNIDSVGVVTARDGLHVTGGSVGIGTDNPGEKLHVNQGNILINQNGTSASLIVTTDTNRDANVYFGDSDSQSQGRIRYNNSADYLSFSTAGANERLRIASNGRIGVNNVSPNATLDIVDGTAELRLTSTGQYRTSLINSASGFLIQQTGANNILFETNGTEKLRITSSGDIGIGDNAPNSSYGTNLSVHSTTTDGARIKISDGTSGKGNVDGLDIVHQSGIAYFIQRENNDMRFYTNSTERFRISNIGQLTTKGNNQGNPVGIEIRNDNTNAYSHAQLSLTSQNGTTSKIWCDVPNSGMRLNYNGGTSVKIDQSGNLVMGNGAGIDFSATSDSSYVMSSELFDDYEEGTWTPTMGYATGYGTQSGKYVKVGKTVHIWFEVQVTGWSTGTGSTWITSGPFPIDKVTGCWAGVINATATTRDWRVGPWTAGGYGMGVWMENGQGSATSAGIRMSENTFSDYSSLTGSLGTNFTMRGGMTYISTV